DARWSEFAAPHPGVVVTPGTEPDVAATVRYCTSNHIPFVTQNGGHGWADTVHLGSDGLLINLRSLRTVVFNGNKSQVTVGGGVAISEVISAASKAGALVQTGNCNCVGALGAILGGGYGNLLGLVGFGVDNLLSVNLVLADGRLQTVTPNDEDLWWALRGAGPNFGIVTSATMKSFPVSPPGQTAWFGQLVYRGDQVEAVVNTIQSTALKPKMSVFLYFMTSGAPSYTPQVVITPFYYGTEAEGRAAFKAFLDLNPSKDTTTELQYPHWNDGADSFCIKGGYKPSYSVGLARMNPSTWKKAWDEYVSFLGINGTSSSIVIMEAYSLDTARAFPESSSSFAWRNHVNFNAVAMPWYYDKHLTPQAEAWGRKLRDLWRSTDGLDAPAAYVIIFVLLSLFCFSVYINFAHGDEALSTVYGNNVNRLKAIKEKMDPSSVFDQWFEV
ncbi:hypothetical protein N7468_000923, partial [Penicillium chermesinum]